MQTPSARTPWISSSVQQALGEFNPSCREHRGTHLQASPDLRIRHDTKPHSKSL